MTDNSDLREQRLHAVLHSYLQAVDAGQAPDPQEIVRQHPDLAAELEAFFRDQSKLNQLAAAPGSGSESRTCPSRL